LQIYGNNKSGEVLCYFLNAYRK